MTVPSPYELPESKQHIVLSPSTTGTEYPIHATSDIEAMRVRTDSPSDDPAGCDARRALAICGCCAAVPAADAAMRAIVMIEDLDTMAIMCAPYLPSSSIM
jgi:hypothetical protein